MFPVGNKYSFSQVLINVLCHNVSLKRKKTKLKCYFPNSSKIRIILDRDRSLVFV